MAGLGLLSSFLAPSYGPTLILPFDSFAHICFKKFYLNVL